MWSNFDAATERAMRRGKDRSVYHSEILDDMLEPVVTRQLVRDAMASCLVCGGKYRPQGGPCIHEHPGPHFYTKFLVMCGQCGERWQPGHTCIPRPTPEQVRDLAEMGSVLRLMDEIVEQLAEELGVAAPAAWEAM